MEVNHSRQLFAFLIQSVVLSAQLITLTIVEEAAAVPGHHSIRFLMCTKIKILQRFIRISFVLTGLLLPWI